MKVEQTESPIRRDSVNIVMLTPQNDDDQQILLKLRDQGFAGSYLEKHGQIEWMHISVLQATLHNY